MSENKNNNKLWIYLLGALVILAIVFVPFVLNPSAEYGGSDDAGSDFIGELSPGYTPWIENFFQPPAETESMLFAVQAAFGGIFIGYFIGYVRGSRPSEKSKSEAENV